MRNRLLFCMAIALAGCSSEAPESQVTQEPAVSVIGDPLHRALDRAESVQSTLDDRAADMRERLEQAEGN